MGMAMGAVFITHEELLEFVHQVVRACDDELVARMTEAGEGLPGRAHALPEASSPTIAGVRAGPAEQGRQSSSGQSRLSLARTALEAARPPRGDAGRARLAVPLCQCHCTSSRRPYSPHDTEARWSHGVEQRAGVGRTKRGRSEGTHITDNGYAVALLWAGRAVASPPGWSHCGLWAFVKPRPPLNAALSMAAQADARSSARVGAEGFPEDAHLASGPDAARLTFATFHMGPGGTGTPAISRVPG